MLNFLQKISLKFLNKKFFGLFLKTDAHYGGIFNLE